MPPPQSLHIYSLPPELIDTLRPVNLLSSASPEEEPREVVKPDVLPPVAQGARSCNICLGAGFTDVEDQRSHFRSDWHRYNVKARLEKGKVVNELDFAVLVESLEDSLSGSESSDNEGNGTSSESDTVKQLLAKTRIRSRSASPTEDTTTSVPRTAVVWFHSPPSTQLGFYRAILPVDVHESEYLNELKLMQAPVPEGRKWTMFMVAGGHFAGIVVRVSLPGDALEATQGKGKQKRPIPDLEILRHKTFHRYTTRRKQGGSQSLNDQAKGNAKSAGAQLRRYGEQALQDDIRNLIEEWADDINESERIWLRANTSNRRIFVGYDGATIAKGDERLRTFPFPTRRPTQTELSRCLLELTKVKITHYTEEELEEQREAYLASLPKPKPKPPTASETKPPEKKPAAPKISKEEEIYRDKWERFLDMVKKGRLDAAKAFWERESTTLGGVDTDIPEWTGERFRTLLQVSSAAGQAEVTAWLLDILNANPTIPVPSGAPQGPSQGDKAEGEGGDGEGSRPATPVPSAPSGGGGRMAYDIASTRAVRDVFRRAAGARPDAWDWFGAAHVPSALNAAQEAERDSKKKERRKGMKDRIREREARAAARAPEPEPEPEPQLPPPGRGGRLGGPQKLGGGASGTVAADGLAGLTPEMRAKVERERRARAAEARLLKR